MSELPPDLPRLRAILAYLDRQVTDNETVGVYLRLRREAARKAVAAAEERAATEQPRPSRPRRPASRTAEPHSPGPDSTTGVGGPTGVGPTGVGPTGVGPTGVGPTGVDSTAPGSGESGSGESAAGGGPATGYVIEPKKHPAHPLPALYHLADCTMIQRRATPTTPHQIRLGLRDPLGILAPCEFCAPDKTLEPADQVRRGRRPDTFG
ncbi:DUF6233 domain-containing protein [Streptomyces sp. NPDC007971]|uniref:DUF6233 domain-containing protein n=1 Tax=Streptomyces sp. NPDC007971 TaxID=3364799 RepID=UPI0036E78176